jgi:hypothetical protein
VITVDDVTVLEGGTALFSVTLSPASGRTVTVDYATANDTATSTFACGFAGGDYVARSGSLSFAPGTTRRGIGVPTCRDSILEGSQAFVVNLRSPVNAELGDSTGRATIVEGSGNTGTFLLSPTDATVAVDERLIYTYTWTVPEPRSWRQLRTVDLRIRDGKGIVVWVRFDEATNTLALAHKESGKFGPGLPPGSPERLKVAGAELHLAETTAVGSGPTGPSVTLTLSLSVKSRSKDGPFLVEVAAADDLGNQDDFVTAGTLTVTPKKGPK